MWDLQFAQCTSMESMDPAAKPTWATLPLK